MDDQLSTLRSDIKDLGELLRAEIKSVNDKQVECLERLTRLEEKYKVVGTLETRFDQHVKDMQPVREEVSAIRKFVHLAIGLAVLLPPAASAVFSMYHPWQDYTRSQIDPLAAEIHALEEKQHRSELDTANRIADFQSQIYDASDIKRASGRR